MNYQREREEGKEPEAEDRCWRSALGVGWAPGGGRSLASCCTG